MGPRSQSPFKTMDSYLVTGAAGFVGYHLCEALLAKGHCVLGVDNLSDYYDTQLKHDRLNQLRNHPQFLFLRLDLSDRDAVARLFGDARFDVVFHMAAQAGVRYSVLNPHAYVDSNLTAFVNILEGCRHSPVTASDLCVEQLGVRSESKAAVLRRRPGRAAGEPLRSHQARE